MKRFSMAAIVTLALAMMAAGCSSDDSPTGDSGTDGDGDQAAATVLRVVIENTGASTIDYTPDIVFFYPDSTDESNVTGGSIGPNNSAPWGVDESEEGAVGITADIALDSDGSVRVWIEEGTWDGFSFDGTEVAADTTSGMGSVISLEYGDTSTP